MLNKFLAFDNSWLLSWNSFVNTSKFLQVTVKIGAEYLIYLVPIGLIVLWFVSKDSKKMALRAVTSGLLVFWVNMAIGKSINRPRPFETAGVKEIIFHRPDYSFPSDHAAFLFALAFSFLFFRYKKLAYSVLILALIVTLSRIAAGIHYPSDIIAGLLVGLILAGVVNFFDRYLLPIYRFVINLAKTVRLA